MSERTRKLAAYFLGDDAEDCKHPLIKQQLDNRGRVTKAWCIICGERMDMK